MNWRNERSRYTAIGAVFGLLFPVVAFAVTTFVSRDITILIGVICTAPLFLGFVARLAGLRQDRLNQINRGLEQLVAERTSSIQTMLDLSGQGFLTIGSDLLVKPEYSQECERIFGGPMQKRRIDELLYADTADSTEFVRGLGLCFAGTTRPEVVFDLIDHEFRIDDKIVHADYRAVNDERIMVILTDVTEELRLQRHIREEDARNERVLRAIRHKADFARFFRDAQRILARLEGTPGDAESLSREVHTFKGTAGFFGFRRTQEVAHEIEDYIGDSSILEQEISFDGRADRLRGALAEELTAVTATLGADWVSEADSIVVPKEKYLRIEGHVLRHHPADEALVRALRDQRKRPIGELLERFPPMAFDLARQRGKQIVPVQIAGGDAIRCFPERIERLVASFGHIIRNMIDHGIEAPAERERLGKRPEGEIRIEVGASSGEITVRFSDDGRGIDLEKITNRAREIGLIGDGPPPPPSQLIPLIFQPNFSTAASVSLVSGRGYGLAAVNHAVRELGGKIAIATRSGKGTAFTVTIPVARKRSGKP